MQNQIRNSTITFSIGHNFSGEEYLALARNGICTEYRPQRFHAIIMRLRLKPGKASEEEVKATVLIFRSGRCVITGLTHPWRDGKQCVRRICRRLVWSLHKGGHMSKAKLLQQKQTQTPNVCPYQLCVRNLVGSRRLPHRVNVHKMAEHLGLLLQLRKTNEHVKDEIGKDFEFQSLRLDQTLFPALRCTFKMMIGEAVNDNGEVEKKTKCGNALIFCSGRVIVTGLRECGELHFALDRITQIVAQFRV